MSDRGRHDPKRVSEELRKLSAPERERLVAALAEAIVGQIRDRAHTDRLRRFDA